MNRSLKLIVSTVGTIGLLIGGAVTVFAHPAMITTDPASGPASGGTNVLGDYFGEGVPIQIHWGSAAGPIAGTATGPTFYVHVATPAGAALGSYSVVVTGRDNYGASIQRSAVFTVTAPVTAVQPPAPSAPAAQPRATAAAKTGQRNSVPVLGKVTTAANTSAPVQAPVVSQTVQPSAAPVARRADALGVTRALAEPATASSQVLTPTRITVERPVLRELRGLVGRPFQEDWAIAVALALGVALISLAVLARRPRPIRASLEFRLKDLVIIAQVPRAGEKRSIDTAPVGRSNPEPPLIEARPRD